MKSFGLARLGLAAKLLLVPFIAHASCVCQGSGSCTENPFTHMCAGQGSCIGTCLDFTAVPMLPEWATLSAAAMIALVGVFAVRKRLGGAS